MGSGPEHRVRGAAWAAHRRAAALALLALAGITPLGWSSDLFEATSAGPAVAPASLDNVHRRSPTRSIQDSVEELDGRLVGSVSRSASGETSQASRPMPNLPGWLAACKRTSEKTPEPNGLISDENLCELPTGRLLLRADAARAWWLVSRRYEQQFGEPLCVTDAYRDLGSQQRLYELKPELAARPGTSNHGLGVAVDLCGGAESFGTAQHAWLRENADKAGLINPRWAQVSGSKPEPWHWEFTPAVQGEE